MIICPDTEIEELAGGVYDWTPERASEAWQRSYQKLGAALVACDPMNTTFIVMVGLPGSGKSTFSSWYDASNATSPRSAIIFDATNVAPMRRSAMLNVAIGAGLKTAAIYVQCNVQVSLARQAARGRKAISGDVIRRMDKQLRKPTVNEGFGAIIDVVTVEPHPRDNRGWIEISVSDRSFWCIGE